VAEKSAGDFIADMLADKSQPVVVFALEWCEFCWSVRKFFARVGIDYTAIELDSVAYQENDRGRKIRESLNAQTGMKTIPQIFIGGQFVGGCTDIFDGWKEGRIQPLLNDCGVDYDAVASVDPYQFLPGWLHPR
jgi:cysteine synthase A